MLTKHGCMDANGKRSSPTKLLIQDVKINEIRDFFNVYLVIFDREGTNRGEGSAEKERETQNQK